MRHTGPIVLIVALAFGCAPALAAGYGLKEHSVEAMGAAYAGAAASDDDPSFLAYNPAALAGVDTTDMSFSLVGIDPGTRAHYTNALTSAGTPTGGAANPANFISDAVVPAFALRHRLSDRLTVGLSISAPWGLRTDYPTNWAGRYYAEKTELLTIDAVPSVAYQITPELTLGAGVQIEFAQGALTEAVDTGTIGAIIGVPGSIPGAQDSFARLGGKNWSFGYTAGLMYKPEPGLSFGIAYHSSVQHDLEGPLRFTLDPTTGQTVNALTHAFDNTRGTAPLIMPDVIESGARIDLSDQLSGMAELDWTHWSRFRDLTILTANPAQPGDVTTTHWHDAFFGSLGLEYRAAPGWAFRVGTAYDQSPAPDATREPRIPDADRIWISAGVRAKLNDAMDVDFTLSRLFFLKSTIAVDPSIPGAALRGTLDGTTTAYADVAGLQVTWRAN